MQIMRCVIGQSNLIKDMTNRIETRRMKENGARGARAGEFIVCQFGFYFYFSISRGALSAGSDG